MTHATHKMHHNSLQSRREIEAHLDKRSTLVLEVFKHATRPMSCRDVLNNLFRRGRVTHCDMNLVRPRITELSTQKRLLREVDTIIDDITHRQCSRYEYVAPGEEPQMELAL